MRRVAPTLAILACALAGAVRAAAQPAPTLPAAAPTPDLVPRDLVVRFETADLDNSGGLTRDEAVKGGFSTQAFEAVDQDKDRIVTVYEIGVYLSDRTREWVEADTDGDGHISRAEAAAHPTMGQVFSQADSDADGILRKQEHEAWSQTSLVQNVDLPFVVPNIINKRF